MDLFEKHIRDNRKELDEVETPETDALWQDIQDKLAQQAPKQMVRQLTISHRRLWWMVGVAASLAFVLGIGLTLWHTSPPEPFTTTTPLASISKDLAPMEQDFQQTIQAQYAALNLDSINQKDFKDIFFELQQLDKAHNEYIRDIPAFKDKDQLVKVLIKYYELKIRILKRLNREIERKEHYERKI
ncbi:MAG: hypothetical protein KDC79_03425 [Cyclobacteriaceae bacterium]|nr:hypothetical protein [Cyclobacteriaceae bacterium]